MTALLERPQARSAEPGRSQFFVDFNFTHRVVEDAKAASAGWKLPPEAAPEVQRGDIILTGYASTWIMDRDFEFILRTAYDKTLPLYLAKNPIVLWQHNHDWPIGQVADAYTDETGLYVTVYIRKPQPGEEGWRVSAFNDIKAGIVRTFSVGGWFTREFVEGEIFVVEIDLFEISVVSVPSNPDSIFEAGVKNLKGLPLRTTGSKAANQMAQLLGMEPLSDPAIIALGDREKLATYHRLAADLATTKGVQAPAYSAWRDLNDALATAQPADAPRLAAQAEEIVAALFGPPPATKAGRVLSKANERALRGAAEKLTGVAADIQSVLDQLPAEDA